MLLVIKFGECAFRKFLLHKFIFLFNFLKKKFFSHNKRLS